ncbi:MAG: type II toxin-antitoxin system HipA family toxin YjjJ [Aquabacterium sp.]|nr:type II toxin-antitoxin system HipA family toxin YjjJ [Aquabacterium sp.]
MDPFPIYRIDPHGQLTRLGVMTLARPDVFVMHQDDGKVLTSEGLPWWLLDMRPQGFMGKAFAAHHAAGLGLPANINEWSDRQALRAVLQQGHDVVGNLVLGDQARDHFVSQPVLEAVSVADKGAVYADLAQKAMQGDLSGSFAAGEQPKFTAYAQTPAGPRHVLVKFSLAQSSPANERWRDLLLAEHHALETLREAGHNAAASRVHDYQGQRFLEVERFDRVGQMGRRGLVSLAALEAEFVGNPRAPWPVLVEELARQKVVSEDAVLGTQTLFAFGRLIGNTDMHTGNLSFLTDGGMPYALAPAYDMLPMAFAPGANGSLCNELPPADLHPSVPDHVWRQMRDLAGRYLCLAAEQTRLDQRLFMVSGSQYQALMDLLDRPEQANEGLRDLFARKAPWETK